VGHPRFFLRGKQPLAWLLAAALVAGSAVAVVRYATQDDHRTELSPGEGSQDPAWFADVTTELGLAFVHDAGPVGGYFLPQHLGSGVALFDFDNDGRLDIYLIQNAGPHSTARNQLFRQEADGHFTDVSAGSGLDVAGYGMGVAVGDVNNDGWPDLFLTEYGRVRLFLNNGDGKCFTDITAEAGLTAAGWATSACFLDFDRDGWLDLVVVNYVDYDPSRTCAGKGGKQEFCGPQMFSGSMPRLYRNLGRRQDPRTPHGVRFEDVTLPSGLGRARGRGLGVVSADFNGDHWPDIFIANDAQANTLWINQQDGTFKEEAVSRGLAYDHMGQRLGNMGIAVGDVDGDGLFDVLVTHLIDETHTLWKQGPRGLFQDRTVAAGLSGTLYRGTGFGTALADFDQDGALDLAVVNGAVSRGPGGNRAGLGPFWSEYVQRNQLLANDGRGRFRDLAAANPAFCGSFSVARGLACGDLHNRGSLDLVVTAIADRARLYRNVVPRQGHWLSVRAIDPGLRRDAYGAEIVVGAGGRRWQRSINPGSSFLCSNDPRAHFGLGGAERVGCIEVRWPDGTHEVFGAGPVDRHVKLVKGQGPQWQQQ
jgi:hypothetical protein